MIFDPAFLQTASILAFILVFLGGDSHQPGSL